MTNSEIVKEIMEENVIYNSSDYLLDDYISMDIKKQKQLFKNASRLIAEKHTYVNRIDTILSMFKDK